MFRDRKTPPPRRVLIVEDDWAVLEVLKLMLEDEGYLVVTARRGRDAIKLAASKPFDLVLMDISMPEMSGIELARLLRAEARTAGVLIAIHTGLDEHWVRERFTDYDLFLTKAADTHDLVRRIGRLFELGAPRRDAASDARVEAFTTADAARAQQALRDAMGLGPETLSLEALIGMLGDELDQLRRIGKTDADLAAMLSAATGRDIPVSALGR